MATPYYWNIPIYASSMADLGRQESEWARTNLNTAADNLARDISAQRYANDLAAQRDARDQQAAEVAYRWGTAAQARQDQLKQQELDRKQAERHFTSLSAGQQAEQNYRNKMLDFSRETTASELLAKSNNDIRSAALRGAENGLFKSPQDIPAAWLNSLGEGDRQYLSKYFTTWAENAAEDASKEALFNQLTREDRINETVRKRDALATPEDKALPNYMASLRAQVSTLRDDQLEPPSANGAARAAAIIKSTPVKRAVLSPQQFAELNRWPTIAGAGNQIPQNGYWNSSLRPTPTQPGSATASTPAGPPAEKSWFSKAKSILGDFTLNQMGIGQFEPIGNWLAGGKSTTSTNAAPKKVNFVYDLNGNLIPQS